MRRSSILSSLVLLGAFACGDDTARDSNGGGATAGTADTGEGAEGNQTADGNQEADGPEGGTGETDTTEGETGPLECVDLEDEALCAETEGCLALSGSKLNDKGSALCLEPAIFVGCIDDPGSCDAAITYGCKNANNVFEFTNGCLPDGWDICEPDIIPTEPCP